MEMLLVVILGAMLLFAVGTLMTANGQRAALRNELDESKQATNDLQKEIGNLKSAASKAGKTSESKEAELSKVREDLKKAKKRAHEKLKESEELATRVADLRAKQQSYVGLDEAREEMMNARTEAANLRAELAGVKAELGAATVTAPVADLPAGDDVDPAELRGTIATLSARLDAQKKELRGSYNESVRAERKKFVDELRDLRRRLNRALTDMDRERRRADNNDKAYLIMKSQLEAALDRLAGFDPNLRRPDALTSADLEPKPPKAEAPAQDEVVTEKVTAEEEAPAEEVTAEEAPVEEAAAEEAAAEEAAAEEAPAEEAAAEEAPAEEAAAEEAPAEEAPAEEAAAEEAPAEEAAAEEAPTEEAAAEEAPAEEAAAEEAPAEEAPAEEAPAEEAAAGEAPAEEVQASKTMALPGIQAPEDSRPQLDSSGWDLAD